VAQGDCHEIVWAADSCGEDNQIGFEGVEVLEVFQKPSESQLRLRRDHFQLR